MTESQVCGGRRLDAVRQMAKLTARIRVRLNALEYD